MVKQHDASAQEDGKDLKKVIQLWGFLWDGRAWGIGNTNAGRLAYRISIVRSV